MAEKKSSNGDGGKTGGNAKSSGPGFGALDRVFLTLGPSRTTSVGPTDLELIDKESKRVTKKSS